MDLRRGLCHSNWMESDGKMAGAIRTESLEITAKILSRVAELDEFKGTWRAIGRIAPDRLSSLRRVATIESLLLARHLPRDDRARLLETVRSAWFHEIFDPDVLDELLELPSEGANAVTYHQGQVGLSSLLVARDLNMNFLTLFSK